MKNINYLILHRYLLIAVFFFASCDSSEHSNSETILNDTIHEVSGSEIDPNTPEVLTEREFYERGYNFCDSVNVEVVFIHNDVTEVPEITVDTLTIDNRLRNEGFTHESTSHGNWQYGPRMITMNFSKDSCQCVVLKKYQSSNDTQNDTLFVTEQIICGYGFDFPFSLIEP